MSWDEGRKLTDRSGTVASGGTAQQLAPVNDSRSYLFIQNQHATEVLWINFSVDAVTSQPSIQIPAAGGTFLMSGTFCSGESISVIAATSTHPFTAKEG